MAGWHISQIARRHRHFYWLSHNALPNWDRSAAPCAGANRCRSPSNVGGGGRLDRDQATRQVRGKLTTRRGAVFAEHRPAIRLAATNPEPILC